MSIFLPSMTAMILMARSAGTPPAISTTPVTPIVTSTSPPVRSVLWLAPQECAGLTWLIGLQETTIQHLSTDDVFFNKFSTEPKRYYSQKPGFFETFFGTCVVFHHSHFGVFVTKGAL